MHQATLQQIIDQAEQEKLAKIEELKSLKVKFTHLMQMYYQSQCDEYIVEEVDDHGNRFPETRHRTDCKKCFYHSQAGRLHINLHEWPLPSKSTKAKVVVFELQVPFGFKALREATFFLLQDVLKVECSSGPLPRASYNLPDQHLRSFSQMSHSLAARIGLLSEDKPHVVTHRNPTKVSTADESSVCVQNGLNYRYYDSSSGKFVSRFEFNDKVAWLCMYRLPFRATNLQKYMFRPAASPNGPSPNTPIALQSEVPYQFSLEEAKALSNMPLGTRIQWNNILLQLAAPSIDFKKNETALFIMQCIYQAGPPDAEKSTLRESHSVTNDDDTYTDALLDSLSTALNRIKENWESAHALGVFSAIARRLLSLGSSPQIHTRCLDFLRSARDTAFGWATLLRSKAQAAATDEDRSAFRSKSVEVATICALSFDVDDQHLCNLLHPSAASIFIQCSIIVQEGKRTFSQASDPVLFLLNLRFRRLLYRTCAIFRNTCSGLEDAVQNSWSAYRPGSGWRTVSSHWSETDTDPDERGESLRVHYNLLSGELLVDGLPLDRPPRQYEDHERWSTLFGHSTVEVMPTSVPGMQFSAKRKYQGYNVHFGINTTEDTPGSAVEDLVVRASNEMTTYETVPARLLQGEFPEFFVRKFVHWYNHTDGTLEFRPIKKPWENSSAVRWTLSKCDGDLTWRLMKDGNAVIGSKTKTASTVAGVLSTLADRPRIHVILQSSRKTVEVEIPTLPLGFSLNSGQSLLESREYRGMVVAGDQALGTLFGFANKLLLKHKSADDQLVLIPEGPVSHADAGPHVTVNVDKRSIVKVHPLHVDERLGRLIDNGSLQGKLFLAYLHALTAFCLPDPLFQLTGTEQALTILRSAAVRSFDQLSQANVDTLSEIARLTPGRCFYPPYEHVQQSISWSSQLSFLSQHPGFLQCCRFNF